MRLNKYLAQNLQISRRNADEIIAAGHVKINRHKVNVGTIVTEDDVVEVDGEVIKSRSTHEYYKFYKPKGYICSHEQQGDSPIIFDLIGKQYLKFGGRLDKDSEGLMLLSTDGDWLNNIFNAKNKITKKYIIKIKFPLPKGKKFKQNINHNGEVLKIINYKLINKYTYEVALKTGKNHEIRRIFRFNNLKITTLKRNRIGKYSLKDLSPGDLVKINLDE